ncbi:hypothetical protein DIPPA_30374 [Diplonema papillatum]|nr:hypothetical protein DIPPA_30374 [Diplonema papillatum]
METAPQALQQVLEASCGRLRRDAEASRQVRHACLDQVSGSLRSVKAAGAARLRKRKSKRKQGAAAAPMRIDKSAASSRLLPSLKAERRAVTPAAAEALHAVWAVYAEAALAAAPDKSAKVRNLELLGARVKISAAPVAAHVGRTGVCVRESDHWLHVLTGNTVLVLQKAGTELTVAVGGKAWTLSPALLSRRR